MPRNRHQRKPSGSQFPISEPANTRPQVSSSGLDDLSNIEVLLEKGNFEEALAQEIDSAPKWMKRSPEFVLMQATTLMDRGRLGRGRIDVA